MTGRVVLSLCLTIFIAGVAASESRPPSTSTSIARPVSVVCRNYAAVTRGLTGCAQVSSVTSGAAAAAAPPPAAAMAARAPGVPATPAQLHSTAKQPPRRSRAQSKCSVCRGKGHPDELIDHSSKVNAKCPYFARTGAEALARTARVQELIDEMPVQPTLATVIPGRPLAATGIERAAPGPPSAAAIAARAGGDRAGARGSGGCAATPTRC